MEVNNKQYGNSYNRSYIIGEVYMAKDNVITRLQMKLTGDGEVLVRDGDGISSLPMDEISGGGAKPIVEGEPATEFILVDKNGVEHSLTVDIRGGLSVDGVIIDKTPLVTSDATNVIMANWSLNVSDIAMFHATNNNTDRLLSEDVMTNDLYFATAYAVAGEYIEVDFEGEDWQIDEMEWKQGSVANHGIWQPQVSYDGSTYENLGSSITLSGSSFSFTPTYKRALKFRLLGVSGNTNNSPWLYGLILKVA